MPREKMTNALHRRNSCRLCGESHLEIAFQLAPTPPADAYVPAEKLEELQQTYPLALFFCNHCGHLQLADVIDPEILFRDYIYETESSPGLVEHFRKYAEEVTAFLNPKEDDLVIDIGSNDGTLLRFFQGKGMRALGIDPAREIAGKATSSGIETLPEFFTSDLAKQLRQRYGAAAVVTANNVFAHADHLADMADGIHDLLAPDGVFVFEVSYLADLIENRVFDFIYHEHLCYHAVKPLVNFFRLHEMDLIRVDRIPTKGGSIRGMAQRLEGHRPVDISVSELLTLEDQLGLQDAETFKRFAGEIDAIKDTVLGFTRDLKGRGKTIAGYGASATGTTLVYHFELGDLLSFIVDDNPERQGLFSPGYHIPVLPPRTIYERRPDHIVVLAWRFYEPILKRHQAYLDRGGHFIVPLPEFRVI
jgi:SAM-dependent methyltransferase